MPRWAIVVHGGCGRWLPANTAAALAGVRAAVASARTILAAGGTALDAVCAAVVALEDDPLFNAGTGSTLNHDGDAEMDASVMVDDGLRCGGVAAIRRVRNPVLVARKVMEGSPHVLLAGDGALAFARAHGFRNYDPVVRASRARSRRAVGGNTVGAVALDANGMLAAATSTGGTAMKLPGRVGDSPIPGAGNYATRAAAASATGHGELMMRTLATKTICDLVAGGRTAPAAASRALAGLAQPAGQSTGFIVVDRSGRVGAVARGGAMPHAWCVDGTPRVVARMRAGR